MEFFLFIIGWLVYDSLQDEIKELKARVEELEAKDEPR